MIKNNVFLTILPITLLIANSIILSSDILGQVGLVEETASINWIETNPMLYGIAEIAVSTNGQNIYVPGGNAVECNQVIYSSIQLDGTLGSWSRTTPLPICRWAHQSIIYNGYIFIIGGYIYPITESSRTTSSYLHSGSNELGYDSPEGGLSSVMSAPINPDGTLGSWSALTPLPNDLYRHTVVVNNGRMYAIGGWSDILSSMQKKVYMAPIYNNGLIGSWVQLESLPVALDGLAAAVYNGDIFVIGGRNSATIFKSSIMGDGALGPWSAISTMPQALFGHSAVIWNKSIVVMGGRNSAGTIVSNVYTSPIGTDGDLGEWLEISSLPQPSFTHASLTNSGNIYVIGGSNPYSGRLDKVYLGKGSLPIPSYSISGRVTDADDIPIGQVEITTSTGSSTFTQSDGSYILTGIAEGNVQIYPSKAGYIFYPGSLSIDLTYDKSNQDFVASMAVCEIYTLEDESLQIDSLQTEFVCPAPLASAPFLYLPVRSPYPPYIVLMDTNFKDGGRVDSWFDHDTPTYLKNVNYRIELFDGIPLTDYYKTLDNGLKCYNQRCYDGHNGLDFHRLIEQDDLESSDLTVVPAASGIIKEVCDEEKFESGECSQPHSLGRFIIISHLDDTYATLYAHLASIEDWVKPGVEVYRNDYSTPLQIAVMGGSGGNPYDLKPTLIEDYWGVHLHFQVFYNGNNQIPWTPNSGEVVDPYGWQPLDGSNDEWKWPSVPLWIGYSPVSCIPGTDSATLSLGAVSVQIPAGTVDEDQVVSLSLTSFSNTMSSVLRSIGSTFSIDLFDLPTRTNEALITSEDPSAVTTNPVTANVDYAGMINPHLVASEISFYRFDSLSSMWISQATTLDEVFTIASAQVIPEGYFDLQAPLVCPADSTEPYDDSPDNTGILPALQTENTLLRWFDIQQDQDWFRLEGVTGITHSIETQNLANDVDTILTVYAPDGETILVTDDNSGGGFESKLSFKATENGIYYILVSQAIGSAYGCDSSYQVKFTNDLHPVFLPIIALQQ